MIRLLAAIWAASGYLCGQRLKAAIPHGRPWLTRRAAVTPTPDAPRRRIRARPIDRRLGERKQRITRRRYGPTRPGALLTHQIPSKTDPWEVPKPGDLEIAVRSHAGASAAGA